MEAKLHAGGTFEIPHYALPTYSSLMKSASGSPQSENKRTSPGKASLVVKENNSDYNLTVATAKLNELSFRENSMQGRHNTRNFLKQRSFIIDKENGSKKDLDSSLEENLCNIKTIFRPLSTTGTQDETADTHIDSSPIYPDKRRQRASLTKEEVNSGTEYPDIISIAKSQIKACRKLLEEKENSDCLLQCSPSFSIKNRCCCLTCSINPGQFFDILSKKKYTGIDSHDYTILLDSFIMLWRALRKLEHPNLQNQ